MVPWCSRGNRRLSRDGRHGRRAEAVLTSPGGGDNEPRVNRVLRGLAVAMLLVLAGGVASRGRILRARAVASPQRGPPPLRRFRPPRGESYAALCAGAPGCPSGGVPTALRRPIHLPHIAAGALCPVSAPGHRVTRYATAVIGLGPIYAVSLGPFGHTAILPFVMPSQAACSAEAPGEGRPSNGTARPPTMARCSSAAASSPPMTGSASAQASSHRPRWMCRPAATIPTPAAGDSGRGTPGCAARDATACKSMGPPSARSSSSEPALRATPFAKRAAASRANRTVTSFALKAPQGPPGMEARI